MRRGGDIRFLAIYFVGWGGEKEEEEEEGEVLGWWIIE